MGSSFLAVVGSSFWGHYGTQITSLPSPTGDNLNELTVRVAGNAKCNNVTTFCTEMVSAKDRCRVTNTFFLSMPQLLFPFRFTNGPWVRRTMSSPAARCSAKWPTKGRGLWWACLWSTFIVIRRRAERSDASTTASCPSPTGWCKRCAGRELYTT